MNAPNTFRKPERLLIEDFAPISLSLVERADGSGKIIVRGEFARGDVATENKRIYKTKLWERETNRLAQNISEKKMLGELDHPADGRTQLTRVSHIISDLRIENGVVVGEAEILETARGNDLRALLKSGARIGVSSRGYGSTVANDKGEDVVQEDYRLATFDFVADPANRTSYPDVFFEEKEREMKQENANKPDPESQKGESSEALKIVAEQRDQIREEERKKLLANPSVTVASKVVEDIKTILRPLVLPEDANKVSLEKDTEITRLKAQLAENETKIQDLEASMEKLAEMAKEAGYKFFVEKSISGDENADFLRSVVGDVGIYESVDAITSKIAAARKEIRKRSLREQTLRQEREREKALVVEDRKALDKRVRSLEETLTKSTELNTALSVQLYAEKRLAAHPQAAKVRQVIESAKPTSKDQVDKLVEEYQTTPKREADDLDAVRARVRALTKGGRGSTPLDEEAPEKPQTMIENNYNDLGVDLKTLKSLSGISS